MSLNAEERRRTSAELRANLERSGAAVEQVETALGFEPRRVADTLTVRPGCDPVDVWLLRDHLESLVRHSGQDAVPFTVLTEGARAAANGWFGLRTAP